MSSGGGSGRAILAHRGFENCKLSLGGEHHGQSVPILCPAPQIAVRSGVAVYVGSGVSRGTLRGDPGPRHAGGLASRFSMILLFLLSARTESVVGSLVFLAQLLSFGQSEGWTLEMDGSSIPARAQHCRSVSRMTR